MKKESKITVKSAFKIKGISINGENPIHFDSWLSERSDVLDKLLYDDDKNYNIIAGMNSGKTRGIVEHIFARNDKQFVPAVLCVPLKIIVDQLHKDVLDESHIELGKVHGDILDDDIERYLLSPGKKLFVCVYDSLH